jgi:hypothetical protein
MQGQGRQEDDKKADDPSHGSAHGLLLFLTPAGEAANVLQRIGRKRLDLFMTAAIQI